MPERFVGLTGVAKWFKVSPAAVAKWLVRYDDFPEPDGLVYPGRGRPGDNGVAEPDRIWKDTPEVRAAWERWHDARPGRGAKGTPKPGSGRRKQVPEQG